MDSGSVHGAFAENKASLQLGYLPDNQDPSGHRDAHAVKYGNLI